MLEFHFMPPSIHDLVLIRTRDTLLEIGVAPASPILCGVSGGLDSMALLHILHQLGYQVTAAHVNFQLRGEASDADARFVEKWCLAHDIPVLVHTVNTKAYARELNLNIQLAAREIRYQWWENLLQQGPYTYVATGHHLDDSIETVWLNLLRGTGVKGIQGIRVRRDQYIRPLSGSSRAELEAYSRSAGIEFRTDESNLGDAYTRNRLRHHLLPIIRELYPDYTARFRHTLQRLRLELSDYQQVYDAWVAQVIKPVQHGFIINMTGQPHSFLLRWLEEKGFPWTLADQYIHASDPVKGKPLVYMGWQLSRTSDGFALEEMAAATSVRIEGPGYYDLGEMSLSIESYSGSPDFQKTPNDTVFIRSDVIQWPLTIRSIEAGDRFQPFGLEGHTRKLQDYLIDLKLEPYEKKKVLVLTNPEHILWVMGYRLDERCRVDQNEQEMYRLMYRPGVKP